MMGGRTNVVRAVLSPANPKVGDRMSIAALNLQPQQVATLRVHTGASDEQDYEVQAHADDSGTIAYPNWHVFRESGLHALAVEVGGKVVASATVEVA